MDLRQFFDQAMEQTRMAVCIVDPHADDAPMVFVNHAFLDLTGYERGELIGRNCRLLQGPGTDPLAVGQIRNAIAEEKVTVIDILNYRKDGKPFWNALHLGPVYDDNGLLCYFYGSLWDITELVEERERSFVQQQLTLEMQHRANNLFAVLTSLVRLSARGETDARSMADKIVERITALGRAQHTSIAADLDDVTGSDFLSLVEAVLRPYRSETAARIELAGPVVELNRAQTMALGMTLHELGTNALKYGSLRADEGRVRIEWDTEGNDLVIVWSEHGGEVVEASTTPKGTGTGSAIMRGMLSTVRGTMVSEFRPDGFATTIRVPA